MPLDEYKRKRDFRKTPEPQAAGGKKRSTDLSYVVQKHDATRLHYDFRLELDGVLLSWAVTKGPSLNPADKRLAVRTEDHPLAYGTFEGTIPKNEYGGGTVMVWDSGSWEPRDDPYAGLKKGHLAFKLHGKRLKGSWDLVRMRRNGKKENWLLIKKKDAESGKSMRDAELLKRFSSSVATGRSMDEIAAEQEPASKPVPKARNSLRQLLKLYPAMQLATLVDKVPEGDEWLHEVKFDGYRLLGFVSDGTVSIRTRNGKDWTKAFPSITTALKELEAANAVLDMEAVVLDAEGKSSFQALQSALGRSGNRESVEAYAFDLLHLDGKSLTDLPLKERKQALKKLLKGSAQTIVLRYSDHILGKGPEMFAKACDAGLEGIISKQADTPYEPGRQKSWLKVKCGKRQEFIVLGFSAARSGHRALGALYLGYRKNNKISYAGKVGTGFSMQGAKDLASRLARLAVKKPVLTRAQTKGLGATEWSAIRWVKPVLICEVTFTEWTKDGRVRHPSYQGLREDKDADDVEKETPIPTRPSARATSGRKNGTRAVTGIPITHADRIVFQNGKITKGELAEYYAAVARFLVPRISRHPLSLLRCPSGVDGDCFYQRNPGKGLGPDVHPFPFKHKKKSYEYLFIEDEKGLLELIQMGAIEIHPWGASVDSIDYPDRLIFDLDPAPGVPFRALKLAARDLRQRLQQKGLQSLVKCTGGKGLHVTVPLAGQDKWPAVKSFGASLAKEMVADAPEIYVATMSKAKRRNRIFIDYFRNDYTATAIADYAVRAREGAPVAVPLEWSELESLKSASQFTMKDVLKRMKGRRVDSNLNRKGQTVSSS